MRVRQLPIAGCLLVEPIVRADERGRFVKPFSARELAAAGVHFSPVELFHSDSRRGVIRGLHFQSPPSHCGKLVTCTLGEAFDALVDLRADSPTYAQSCSVLLTRVQGNAVFVPPGVAHGFQALSEVTTLVYLQDRAYDAAADDGVHFESAGITWPLPVTDVSPRDRGLQHVAEFVSPFRMAP